MTRARVALLGMGKMGSAMALRLREKGHAISIWSRTAAKAEEVRAQILPGECTVSATPAQCIAAAALDAPVVVVLSDTTSCLALIEELNHALNRRTLVNLCSGSPDDGRQVGDRLAALTDVRYADGSYCGPPAKARQGAGLLFLSGSDPDVVEPIRPLLSELGEVSDVGPIGASRALDYAVVDLALVSYGSLCSNIEMLGREGVDRSLLHACMAKRLAMLPQALKDLHARMDCRSDESYHERPVATLRTIRDFWASRLPYMDARRIPSDWPRFMAALCERAAGSGGEHLDADVSRMQEAMRSARDRDLCGEGAEATSRTSAQLAPSLSTGTVLSAACAPSFHIINAFTSSPFAGNPTCECCRRALLHLISIPAPSLCLSFSNPYSNLCQARSSVAKRSQTGSRPIAPTRRKVCAPHQPLLRCNLH